MIGEDAFRRVNDPVEVDGQRASGLRFADVAVQALFSALLVFRLLPRGFSNRDFATTGLPCWGKPQTHDPGTDDVSPAAFASARPDRADPEDAPLPGDQAGWRTALFCTRTYNRSCVPASPRSFPIEVLDDSELAPAASTSSMK